MKTERRKKKLTLKDLVEAARAAGTQIHFSLVPYACEYRLAASPDIPCGEPAAFLARLAPTEPELRVCPEHKQVLERLRVQCYPKLKITRL